MSSIQEILAVLKMVQSIRQRLEALQSNFGDAVSYIAALPNLNRSLTSYLEYTKHNPKWVDDARRIQQLADEIEAALTSAGFTRWQRPSEESRDGDPF